MPGVRLGRSGVTTPQQVFEVLRLYATGTVLLMAAGRGPVGGRCRAALRVARHAHDRRAAAGCRAAEANPALRRLRAAAQTQGRQAGRRESSGPPSRKPAAKPATFRQAVKAAGRDPGRGTPIQARGGRARRTAAAATQERSCWQLGRRFRAGSLLETGRQTGSGRRSAARAAGQCGHERRRGARFQPAGF